MIYNEDAYYTGYARNVREFGGGSKGSYIALVFDTIAGLIRETGTGEVANSTILDMYGGSAPTLRDAISVLISKGYLDRKSGDGRGNKSVYIITKKGKENCPFMQEKGEKIFPKRGKNFSIKGKESFTLNKELNKELKEREETPTPANLVMEDFLLFCELYPVDPVWSHEKDACERVWSVMENTLREKLLDQLKNGKRWRVRENDNPYWYLKDYTGQDAKVELPFVWNGDKQITRWIQQGEKVIVMLYQEGDKKGCIYCLEKDRGVMEVAGAKYLRNM